MRLRAATSTCTRSMYQRLWRRREDALATDPKAVRHEAASSTLSEIASTHRSGVGATSSEKEKDQFVLHACAHAR